MPANLAQWGFRERTRSAVKVQDLGSLGDTVRLLPVPWISRQAYPQAELHLVAAEHMPFLIEALQLFRR
jgi:hypothetical protein